MFRRYHQKIFDEPHNHSNCLFWQDFILQKGHIWLLQGAPSISTILAEFHSTPTAGHMGVMKTLTRVRENFTWANMKNDVCQYVANCISCQQSKYDHRRSLGLLCPLPIPTRPWEDLSLDFIVGLPNFQGHSTILVAIDRFSKGVHLGMLPTQYSASGMARMFMDIVGKIHSMPRSLVSDRDPPLRESFLVGIVQAKRHEAPHGLSIPPSDRRTDRGHEPCHRAVPQSLCPLETIHMGAILDMNGVVV